MPSRLSIIIPLAEGESAHHNLLAQLPDDAEIILSSEGSRAKSLNIGAAKATREFLWFLHADSELSPDCVEQLCEALLTKPDQLFFFTLAFKNAPFWMKLNEWGVRIRANFCKIPFGDQGFCMHRNIFAHIGKFDETAPYGEDHLFVWQARAKGIKLSSLAAKIHTSPRRYQKEGWLKTTLRFQYLWIKQALSFKQRAEDVAIAIFVKTPNVSPIKTRLAADIGVDMAEAFYLQSLHCTMHTVEQSNATAYFAVAEEEELNNPLWNAFNAIHSGRGDLGERLHHVYSTILTKHDSVILIGADCPQMTTQHIEQALARLKNSPYVMGPATDGGFYLFAGNTPITKETWTNVEYSVDTTRSELTKALDCDIPLLEMLTDVDTIKDLEDVKAQMASALSHTQAHKNDYR